MGWFKAVADSTGGRRDAARQHLILLRDQHERLARDDRYYVRLAFTYGVTVEEIVAASGLPIERVRAVLGGGR